MTCSKNVYSLGPRPVSPHSHRHHGMTIVPFVRTGKSRLEAEYGQGVLEAGLFDLYGCYPFTDQMPRLPPLPGNKCADDSRLAGTDPGFTPTRRHLLTDSASLGAGKIWA